MVDGPRRPIARIASDPRDQLGEIDEFVRLTAQFIRHHRRLGRDRRHDRHPNALALNRFDQRPEIAVAREQDHQIEMRRHIHGVDRELDVHVALDFTPSGGVDEFLRRLRHHRITVVVEPVDQADDRGIFLIVDQGRVIEGSNQASLALEFLEKTLVVDIESESFRAGIEICPVNKQGDPFQ